MPIPALIERLTIKDKHREFVVGPDVMEIKLIVSAATQNAPRRFLFRGQIVKLVAGTGFEPVTFRL